MAEETKLLIAAVMILATAWLAMLQAAGRPAATRVRRRRERPAHPSLASPQPPAHGREPHAAAVPPQPVIPGPGTVEPVEPVVPVVLEASRAKREWLLDSLPVEPAGAPRDRAAGAGRLAIGITGMAIAGALAVLGISRAFSALFDRFLR